MRAFPSEVDPGSREENAIRQRSRAFSSEVDPGSREENEIKQRSRAFSDAMGSENALEPILA
jgi:hypothetical protein